MKFLKQMLLILATFILVFQTANIAVLGDSVAEIQKKQEAVKQELDQNSNELTTKMSQINQIYQKLSQLEGQQQATQAKISATKKQLKQANLEKKMRVKDVKARMRQLQARQGTNSSLAVLEKSTSLTQWVGTFIALQRLQSVYNDSIDALKANIVTIKHAENNLQTYQKTLNQQTNQVTLQKNKLNQQLTALKTKIANGQKEISQLADRKKQAEAIEAAQKKALDQAKSKAQAAAQVKDQAQAKVTTQAKTVATTALNVSGAKTLTMTATGYSVSQNGLGTYSATGINLKNNPSCVAVDPSVIPLGSIIWVSGYGLSIAGDTGAAISGNVIDLHFATVAQANAWGRRTVTVKIMN